MAYCGSQCLYHWHDEDCEYCHAIGDEIIDTKSYSYSTCSYYFYAGRSFHRGDNG